MYGFGIYTTTYRKTDMVIPHEVVRGHTGSAYGLISGYYFWGNYTLTYIVNGALNGYGYGTGTIYEKERLLIYEAATKYINAMKWYHLLFVLFIFFDENIRNFVFNLLVSYILLPFCYWGEW